MDAQDSLWRSGEHGLADQLAISGEHAHLALNTRKNVFREPFWLSERQPEAPSRLLDGTSLRAQTTAAGLIRLGDHKGDWMSGFDDPLKAGYGEGRRPKKKQPS